VQKGARASRDKREEGGGGAFGVTGSNAKAQGKHRKRGVGGGVGESCWGWPVAVP